jgi:hypothetical protein
MVAFPYLQTLHRVLLSNQANKGFNSILPH